MTLARESSPLDSPWLPHLTLVWLSVDATQCGIHSKFNGTLLETGPPSWPLTAPSLHAFSCTQGAIMTMLSYGRISAAPFGMHSTKGTGETTPDTYWAMPSGSHGSLCSTKAWNRGSVNRMPLFPSAAWNIHVAAWPGRSPCSLPACNGGTPSTPKICSRLSRWHVSQHATQISACR